MSPWLSNTRRQSSCFIVGRNRIGGAVADRENGAVGGGSLPGGMARLSIGMHDYIADQFFTDSCPAVCLIFDITWSRNSVDEFPVDPRVITRHAMGGEPLLETASHLAAIQCGHLHRSDTGLIDIVDDHAGDALVDHLPDRAGAIGEYGGSARHCLDHDEAEWFRPTDRKHQRSGVPQERPFLFLVDLADEFDAPR